MKRVMIWIHIITVIVLAIDVVMIARKIFDNNYDIIVEAYIGLICILISTVCAIYKIFRNKCPHCRKVRLSSGEYCSYCGKKIGGSV